MTSDSTRSFKPVLILLPLAWLAVVAVVAVLTWLVIDSAGRDVLTAGDSPPPATGATPGASEASTVDDRAGGTGARGNSGPKGTGDPSAASPSKPAAPPASSTPSPSSTSTDEPGGAEQEDSSQPAAPTGQPSGPPSDRPDQPAPAPTQVRSWQGTAGTVTASCRGATISLQSATPHDGWAVEVDDRGPEHIKAKFSSRGEEERETEVEAECSGGAPRFQVESDD